MSDDWHQPMGPNECPRCPGQHHWPHRCRAAEREKAMEELRERVTDLRDELLRARTTEERGMTPEEIDGFRVGVALCDAVQDGRKRPPMPANVELGICAGTATNLRDLLTAVLTGDAEAVALAKEIVGA